MYFQIAIDGPSGAGKSTVAKLVAEKLGCVYIDTGAMYRAMGLFFNREGNWPEEEGEVGALCEKADITIENKDGVQRIFLNGEDVSDEIRTEEGGMNASRVSAYLAVREKLVELQRKLAKSTDVVMDGRDIGTVVLPDASLKIYLAADAHVRALRRMNQLKEKGICAELETIESELISRDRQDSTRDVSPLKKADDAVCIDTSDIDINETVNVIIALAKERR